MSEDEADGRPHYKEMPDPRIVKAAHQPGQPGKLNRLPDREAGEYRQNSENDRSGVCMLLKRVIGLALDRLGTKEKIMLHHRPHAGQVARRKQYLPVVSAEKLIAEVN